MHRFSNSFYFSRSKFCLIFFLLWAVFNLVGGRGVVPPARLQSAVFFLPARAWIPGQEVWSLSKALADNNLSTNITPPKPPRWPFLVKARFVFVATETISLFPMNDTWKVTFLITVLRAENCTVWFTEWGVKCILCDVGIPEMPTYRCSEVFVICSSNVCVKMIYYALKLVSKSINLQNQTFLGGRKHYHFYLTNYPQTW